MVKMSIIVNDKYIPNNLVAELIRRIIIPISVKGNNIVRGETIHLGIA